MASLLGRTRAALSSVRSKHAAHAAKCPCCCTKAVHSTSRAQLSTASAALSSCLPSTALGAPTFRLPALALPRIGLGNPADDSGNSAAPSSSSSSSSSRSATLRERIDALLERPLDRLREKLAGALLGDFGILLAAPKQKSSKFRVRGRQYNYKIYARRDVDSCAICGRTKLAAHFCVYCYDEIKAVWKGEDQVKFVEKQERAERNALEALKKNE